MEESNQTQNCALRIGRVRLAYAFTPTARVGGTVKAFTHSDECVFVASSPRIRGMIRAIRDGDLRRPHNITRIETSYAADEYDGIFVAMWLLGRNPIVPHRSRTYRTKGIRRDPNGTPALMTPILHRFVFSDGRLATGLSHLIKTVYGVTPEILVD